MAGIDTRSREEVQRLIVALLVTEKPSYNIAVSKLEYCYREAEGEKIPYKALGYPSIIDFLKTIPQIQLIQRDGHHVMNFLGTEKTKHVSELIAKQRVNPKAAFARSRSCSRRRPPGGVPAGYFQRSHSAMNPPRPPFPSDYTRLQTDILGIITRSPSGISKTTIVQKVRENRPGYFDIHCLHDILNNLGGRVVVRDSVIYPSTNMNNNGQINGQSHHVEWNANGAVVPKKPVTVRNVEVEDGNFCDDDEYGMTDFSNAPSPSRQADDRGNCQNGGDGLQKPNVNDPRTQEAVDMIISERTRFRLEKLIQNCPGGIWCAELGKYYQEEYKIPLEWENLGFNSLSDLVLHLPDIFYCVQPVPSGDFRLYHAQRKVQADGEMYMKPTLASVYNVYKDPEDDTAAVPRERLPPETINHLIPDDVVRMGETIGQVPITSFDDMEKGYEEVVVCDAFTPAFFWIHLRKKMAKLETLMNKIQVFYETKGNPYCVPLIVLEKGLNVACKFYGQWHRGIVTAVEPDSTTTVLFYDYGTVHKYPANEMHFLHNTFSSLPAQAIPCGLYNVKPPEDSQTRGPDGKPRWSIETSRLFVQRVHDKPLIAVCGKECANNSLLLDLTDTSSDEDVNIGEWLVQNKLAVHGSTDVLIDRNDMSNYVEDYDWEAGQESTKTKVPKQDESTKEADAKVYQTVVKFLEIVQSRLFDRGSQLMSTIDALLKLNTKEIDPSMLYMINRVLLLQLKDQVLEDRKTYCSSSSTSVYDVFLPSDCFISDDDSIMLISSVVTDNTLRNGQEESQDADNNNLKTSNCEFNTENSNFINDEETGTLEPIPDIDIDDQESFVSDEECNGYSGYDLPDTNPFKYDILSGASSPYPDVQPKIPPPIPPRTRRASSMSSTPKITNSPSSGINNVSDNVEFNNNHSGEHGEVSTPPQHPPPQLPPRKPKKILLKNFFESTEFNSLEDNGVSEFSKIPDCLQVDLEKCPVFVFIKERSGWITTDQFRVAFTDFSDNLSINMLLIERKDETCFKVVKRENDEEFFDLIEAKIGVFQEGCSSYYLIPVNIVLIKMLRAFDLVTQEDVKRMRDDKVYQHPILEDCSKLIMTYNEFMRDLAI